MATNSLFENEVSAIEERDYYKVLGVSIKHLFFLFFVIGINYLIVYLITGQNPMTIIFLKPLIGTLLFLPSLFAIALVRFEPLSLSLYNFINSTFFKTTPRFNTAYLTEYRKHVNDYIITNPDNKIVVFEINSDDFYNKTHDEKMMIFSSFNRFLLSTTHTLIFRVINKKLNMSTYFEMMRKNVNDDVIHQFYYDNFVKSYMNMSKNIPDYNYYIEILFDKNMSDSQIETELNLILNNMIQNLNVGRDTMPHLLRGNELINYLKNVISGSEFTNIYDVPVITDY